MGDSIVLRIKTLNVVVLGMGGQRWRLRWERGSPLRQWCGREEERERLAVVVGGPKGQALPVTTVNNHNGTYTVARGPFQGARGTGRGVCSRGMWTHPPSYQAGLWVNQTG